MTAPRTSLLFASSAWILALTIGASLVRAQENSREIAIALEYTAAQERVMRADAGSADVDSLLEHVTEDFVYLHPTVGARIEGKPAVRAGIESHLGETAEATIQVSSVIQEGSVVTLVTHTSFRTRDGQAVSRSNTWVLVFRDGRIALRADF